MGVVADRYRGDLESAGKGDGRHGFTLTVPPFLAEREHAVDVRLLDFPDLRLNGTPRRPLPVLGPLTMRAARSTSGPAADDDAQRLWTFLTGMGRLHGGSTAAMPDAETIRSWLAAPPPGAAERCWLIAERRGRIVGHCRIGPEWPVPPGSDGLALGLELHPDVRGRGLGCALMQAAERWAAGRRTRLELAVLPHNARALALYRTLNYTDLGPVAHPTTGEIYRHMALPVPPSRLWRGVTLVL